MSQAPITITGNITHDLKLTFTEGGAAKLAFSVAVNYFWNDANGERQERTSFFNAVAWKQLAEDAASVLEKGMRVVVTGRLEQRSYTDKEGKERQIVEVVVEDIGASVRGIASLERKQSGQKGQQQGQRPNQGKPAQRQQQRQTVPQLEGDEPF